MSQNVNVSDIVASNAEINLSENKSINAIANQVDPASQSLITFKNKLIENYIQPSYERDVIDSLKAQYSWRKINKMTVTVAKILGVIAAIFAFAGAKFTDYWWLAFVAGICNVMIAPLLHFALYATQESTNATNDTNVVLQNIGIHGVPNIQSPNDQTSVA